MTFPRGTVGDPIPRRAARVLLIDAADRVLMFRGFDPARPGVRYWFTVGGGLDEGESPAEAAARELFEETGLMVAPHVLGEPVWREVTDFPFDQLWYRQEQEFYLMRVDAWIVSTEGFEQVEQDSIDAHHWWSVDELEATPERFYPTDLPRLLRSVLGR